MSFKNTFLKNLKEKKYIESSRLEGSKWVFICISFLFFLSFFMVGSGYYREELFSVLGPLYILTLVSLNLYIYFLLQKHLLQKKNIFYGVMGTTVVFSIITLIMII